MVICLNIGKRDKELRDIMTIKCNHIRLCIVILLVITNKSTLSELVMEKASQVQKSKIQNCHTCGGCFIQLMLKRTRDPTIGGIPAQRNGIR